MRSNFSSIAVGAVAALALVVSLGAAAPLTGVARVLGVPAPSELVRLDVGIDFDVPRGTTLVIGSVGSAGVTASPVSGATLFNVTVDGEPRLSGALAGAFGETTSSTVYTPGIPVHGPATVRVENLTERLGGAGFTSMSQPVLNGYLAPTR